MKLLYDLQLKQRKFADTFVKYRLYWGAKWGGKSYAMRAECVKQCLSAPNVRWLALRRTFPEIQENMVIPMQMEVPLQLWEKVWNVFKFKNGSTLRFSHCNHFKDVLKYQGVEYDFICIEELTHWGEDEFKMLMSSLRTSRDGIVPNFFGSTNPWWIWHAWVKRLFIDRDFNKWERPENYAFIPAKVYDNQVIMETMPDYVEALDSLPEMERRAYRDGDWDVFKWQYFKDFRREIHTIEPVIPKNVKRRIIALDYWYSAPSAVYWMSLMSDDTVIVYRELYQTELTYKQLALKIKAMTPELEKIDCIMVDPAIVNKRSETTWTSGSEEMAKVWLQVRWADNARIKGWTVLRQALQHKIDPNTQEITAQLKITTNCENLIRTLPIMIHDETNIEDLNSAVEDHACFTWNMKVSTLYGEKNIKDVKIWEYVLTPIWYKKVLDSWCTGEKRIMKIELSNGKVIEATANHKIYVEWKGLKRVDCLECFDILNTNTINNQLWKKQLLMEGLSTQSMKIKNTTIQTEHILKKALHHYIDKYGLIIMGIFQKGFAFIIKTITQIIMKLKTLNVSIKVFTRNIITKKDLMKIDKCQLLRNGEIVKNEKSNLEEMLLKWLKKHQLENYRAKIVELLLKQKDEYKSIVKNVNEDRGFTSRFVKFVEKHFFKRKIEIEQWELVHISAVGKLEEKTKKVYNLTVQEAGLYYINGILVSNCDALRYGIVELSKSYNTFKDLEKTNNLLKKSSSKQTNSFWKARAVDQHIRNNF